MVPRLKEVDSSFAHFVNQPMFLSYPSRPTSCQQILQRLRFPDATERISQHGFDQLEDAQRYLAVSFYPIAEILPKFRVEYCLSFNDPRQDPSPGAKLPGTQVCLCAPRPGARP